MISLPALPSDDTSSANGKLNQTMRSTLARFTQLASRRALAITTRTPRALNWSAGGVNSLVWIDLEMTGLDVERDKILEVGPAGVRVARPSAANVPTDGRWRA